MRDYAKMRTSIAWYYNIQTMLLQSKQNGCFLNYNNSILRTFWGTLYIASGTKMIQYYIMHEAVTQNGTGKRKKLK